MKSITENNSQRIIFVRISCQRVILEAILVAIPLALSDFRTLRFESAVIPIYDLGIYGDTTRARIPEVPEDPRSVKKVSKKSPSIAFDTFLTCFSGPLRLLRHFLTLQAGVAGEDLFETLWGFRAQSERASRSPYGGSNRNPWC